MRELSEPAARPARTDIDDFKLVNDGLGHSVGDDLLVAVGQRLGHAVRPGDTVARLGGDEFAVLLEDGRMPAAGDAVARRVADSLAEPFPVGGKDIAVRMSTGIAGLESSRLARVRCCSASDVEPGQGYLFARPMAAAAVGALVAALTGEPVG